MLFYAALRDTAHELGLGFVAGSDLALTDISDVAAAGRSGIFRAHRSGHGLARRNRGQRRARRHHIAFDRCRREQRSFNGFGTASRAAPTEARFVPPTSAALPQLSCIDDLAGDAVLNACEKALFGSADSAAAAVAYAANQVTLLISLGDVATANKGAGSDLLALRRAVERDRYGLMAYVLMTRDRCTPQACPLFRSLTNKNRITGQHGRARLREPGHALCAFLERAAASRLGAARGIAAIGTHGQTDQRRIPDLGLDPAGQHH